MSWHRTNVTLPSLEIQSKIGLGAHKLERRLAAILIGVDPSLHLPGKASYVLTNPRDILLKPAQIFVHVLSP
jgi:hypothetical protein